MAIEGHNTLAYYIEGSVVTVMGDMKGFNKQDMGNGVWRISEGNPEAGISNFVDAYLVCGQTRAVLVDTLMGEGNLYDIIREITALPVDVIMTHGHGDHAGRELKNLADKGLSLFMKPVDYEVYTNMSFEPVSRESFQDVSHGQVFDLGGRHLEIIEVPGHTPGSIVVLDRGNQLMFSGDSIGSGTIWMQLAHSLPLEQFLDVLRRLEREVEDLNDLVIYPGHFYQMRERLRKQYISEMRELTENLVSGKTKGVPIEDEETTVRFPNALQASLGAMYSYCYDPDNIFK